MRDGAKGPLVIEAVQRRIQARTETGGTGPEELLLVTRGRQADGIYKHDYYFSNADPGTLAEGTGAGGEGGASRRGVLRAGEG